MPSITRVDVDCYTSKVTACGAISNVEEKQYYTITIYDRNTFRETTLDIFIGKPYKITFYNSEIDGITKVTGKVIRMDNSNITIESMTAIDDYVCLCEHRRYLNDVIKVYTAAIPITNIYSIKPVEEDDLIFPPRPKERTVTIVGVLGLSAEIVRSVVVRLRIYNDDRPPTYEAVPVDMAINNIYKVLYFNRKDGSMYEIIGRLVDIQEDLKFTADNKMNGFVRDETSPPPHCIKDEILGYGNTIYDRDHFFGLRKDNTEGERIYFVFDTSEDLSGTYDKVWLKDIRNVELVPVDTDNTDEDSTEEDNTENNCPYSENCPILHKPILPPEPEINEDFHNHAHWDHMPPPPPMMPPILCPINRFKVEDCNCEECEQLNSCEAFLHFCNGD